MEVIYENKINGGISWIEFLVTTTGGLTEQDKIIIMLPFGWQFSQDSTEVIGRSNNLVNVLPETSISQDQRKIEIVISEIIVPRTLSAVYENDFLRRLQNQIPSGLSFQFRITEMKNNNSFRPSEESIEYYVYSSAGILYEEKVSDMFMKNEVRGIMSDTKNGIIPDDFRTDFEANYTLTV